MNFVSIAFSSKSVFWPQEYVSPNFLYPTLGIFTYVSRGIGINEILLLALSNDKTENLSGGFSKELSLGTVQITNIFVNVSDSFGIVMFELESFLLLSFVLLFVSD